MKHFSALVIGVLGTAFGSSAQAPPPSRGSVPIYRVTVVERTIKAVNYQYRNGPTTVDFRGTVLLPRAKGSATVESKKGSTVIDARFERIQAPTRYGAEYLTYVLWAITPDGHPKNLGEVLAGSSDRASLHVTTDLQAFGLIVTAEPYSAVRQPSDVVVLQNEVRPDTVGRIEPIQVEYELMPRGAYTFNLPANPAEEGLAGPSVSMSEYEKTVEVYQAQNAVQIARSMGADRYAADTLAKAEELLQQAKDAQARKADKTTVVSAARHAAETAEDARAITERRMHDEEVSQAKAQAAREQELRIQAEAEAQRIRAQAEADRMQLDQERTAREAAERQAEAARTLPAPPPQPAPAASEQPVPSIDQQKSRVRVAMLRQLSGAMDTRDTPRGLVVTVSNGEFRGTALEGGAYNTLASVAAVIAAHPGLTVQVEGHTDASGTPARDEQVSYERAAAVRDALVRAGVRAGAIAARGVGSASPLVSNATAFGREQNRRVEITISGDPIGNMPNWDRTYSVVPGR